MGESMQETALDVSRVRIRRLTLRLRTFLAVNLVVSGALGWVIHRARIQRDSVAEIRRAGGLVWYDRPPEVRLPPPEEGLMFRVSIWLEEHVGVDYYKDVNWIS